MNRDLAIICVLKFTAFSGMCKDCTHVVVLDASSPLDGFTEIISHRVGRRAFQ